jgi:GT2 family glycosyltransferase
MVCPQISVIIPHYNRPDSLRRAVDSVQNQVLPPQEIVVVDDCSRPEMRKKVDDIKGITRIIDNRRNLGLAGTRNAGLAEAKCEWVAFLDDDDEYLPDKFRRQTEYLESHPDCEIVGGGLRMVNATGKAEYWGGRATRQLHLRDGLIHTAAMVQTYLARKDVLQRAGGFDDAFRFMEDFEFGIRILAAGFNMHFIAEPLFIYYFGGREQLSRHWVRMLKGHMAAVKKHEDLYRQEFGRRGPQEMYARLFQHYGGQRGGVPGRLVSMAGSVLKAFTGTRILPAD